MTPEEGQFELGALIGEGAFGKVFESFDKKDGKKFAMKKINLRKLSKDERDLAETDARLLTSLQNEYILHAVTAFQENETLCIVTEFCDQGDLAQFLEGRKGEPLDEQSIVEWFRQICSALEYLHGKDVLHRDIKTQNIFLTGNEMTAKLGDFGLAKVLESPTQKVLSFRGSLYYMSPEIYTCKPYNAKTDIWAMGVCVYEMVALKLPFDAPLMQQVVNKIIYDKLPPLPDGYSPELMETIERMMCRDTDRRPSASELLQNVLFKNHSASKVQLFLPTENTTRGNLSTNEDMDNTISDNTFRLNINAREHDSYLPCRSTVLNSESFDARTSDTSLSKASGSETSLEDSYEKNFERTMTADQAEFTFQHPLSSTFTKMRSLFGYFWNKGLPNEKHLYEYFWKWHSVFSQWYPCTFTVDGITYSSAEQYMMHQKAVLMDDKESAEIILALQEPAEIKKVGRFVQNFNQELWESCCLDVVEKGNMAKFSQNEELKKKLIDTYPKTLVEASPIDRIWGIGLSEKDRRAWNRETWRGQNLLGEILTKVRDKLSELKPVPVPLVPVKQRRV